MHEQANEPQKFDKRINHWHAKGQRQSPKQIRRGEWNLHMRNGLLGVNDFSTPWPGFACRNSRNKKLIWTKICQLGGSVAQAGTPTKAAANLFLAIFFHFCKVFKLINYVKISAQRIFVRLLLRNQFHIRNWQGIR